MRCPTCGSPVMVRKNSWECGYCCPCGMDDLSPELLDELRRDKKLSRLVFQSAYVGEEQYHLIDMASELGRPALAAQFMALLDGNPLSGF